MHDVLISTVRAEMIDSEPILTLTVSAMRTVFPGLPPAKGSNHELGDSLHQTAPPVCPRHYDGLQCISLLARMPGT